MTETSKQFTKRPRRKKEPGKSVAVSSEARKAYEDEIAARTARENSYLRHLGDRDVK